MQHCGTRGGATARPRLDDAARGRSSGAGTARLRRNRWRRRQRHDADTDPPGPAPARPDLRRAVPPPASAHRVRHVRGGARGDPLRACRSTGGAARGTADRRAAPSGSCPTVLAARPGAGSETAALCRAGCDGRPPGQMFLYEGPDLARGSPFCGSCRLTVDQLRTIPRIACRGSRPAAEFAWMGEVDVPPGARQPLRRAVVPTTNTRASGWSGRAPRCRPEPDHRIRAGEEESDRVSRSQVPRDARRR
jgi:hypothetical protein